MILERVRIDAFLRALIGLVHVEHGMRVGRSEGVSGDHQRFLGDAHRGFISDEEGAQDEKQPEGDQNLTNAREHVWFLSRRNARFISRVFAPGTRCQVVFGRVPAARQAG